MTDTEIVDYLSRCVEKSGPRDVEVGTLTFTIGLTGAPLREILIAAIGRHAVVAVEKALVQQSSTT